MSLPSQNETYTALPSVVGVEDARELSARILAGPAGMLFCQRILPSAVSRQWRLRSLPSLLADWRKRCLAQTIGLELPAPASATFQIMFSLAPKVSGTSLSSVVPLPLGRRKRSQKTVFDCLAFSPVKTSAGQQGRIRVINSQHRTF